MVSRSELIMVIVISGFHDIQSELGVAVMDGSTGMCGV